MPECEGVVTGGRSRALAGPLPPRRRVEQLVSSTIALAHDMVVPTTVERVKSPERLDRLVQAGGGIAVSATQAWFATCQVRRTSRGVAWRTA